MGELCFFFFAGPLTIETVRDRKGETGKASQIIANIPLKGRDGSLWAADRPALVKCGGMRERERKRERENEMTSAMLLRSSRA